MENAKLKCLPVFSAHQHFFHNVGGESMCVCVWLGSLSKPQTEQMFIHEKSSDWGFKPLTSGNQFIPIQDDANESATPSR